MLRSGDSHSTSTRTPRRAPLQARARVTVEAILDASTQLFAKRGLAATTTNAIAERAGVSIGTLYQYFADKRAIIAALEERHLADAEVALSRALAELAGLPAERWCRELVRVVVQGNAAHDDEAMLYYDPNPGSRPAVSALIDALTPPTGDALRGFGVPGAGCALRARLVLTTVIANVHEVVMRRAAGPGRNAAERELAQALSTLIAAWAR